VVFGLHNGVAVLRAIVGRDNDALTLRDGSRSDFHMFGEAMERFPDVLQYRVVQETLDDLDIFVVAREGTDTGAMARGIVENLRRDVSPVLRYHLRFVPEIEMDPSGKRRLLISKVTAT
jgi:hypothetical protein